MRRLVVAGMLLAAGCSSAPEVTEKTPEPPRPVAQIAPQKADQRIVKAVLEGTGYVSPDTAEDIFSTNVGRLWVGEEYARLDKLAQELLAQRPPAWAGRTPRHVFYEAVSWTRHVDDSWSGNAYRGRNWIKKTGSDTGYIAAAAAVLETMFAMSEGDRTAKELGTYQEQGRRASELLDHVGPKTRDPSYFATRIFLVALDDSKAARKAEVDRVFKQGHALDPTETDMFSRVAQYYAIQARSGGSGLNGFNAQFEDQPDLYARSYGASLFLFVGVDDPWRFHFFRYDKLKAALASQPESVWNTSLQSYAAAYKKDQATARESFGKLGRSFDLFVFPSSARYFDLRSKAGVGEPEGTLPPVLPLSWEEKWFGKIDSEPELKLQWDGLLRQRHFLELEEIAAAYRKDESPERLNRFYQTLGGDSWDNVTEFEDRTANLEAWVAERPDSPTARIAMAEHQLSSAWQARGGGFANTVSDEGWKKFRDRLRDAGKSLNRAEKLGSKDLALFRARMVLARGQSDTEALQEAFGQALEVAPDSLVPYEDMVTPLLPRWFGEAGDLKKLSDLAVEQTRAKYGKGAAAVIGFSAMEWEGLEVLEELGWADIVQGVADLEKRGECTPGLRNQLAYWASLKKDRAAAASAFKKLGPDDWVPARWGIRTRYEADRAWALTGAPWPESDPTITVLRAGKVDPQGKVTSERTIPCTLQAAMGVEYKLTNRPARPIRLVFAWEHPPIIVPKDGKTTLDERRATLYPDRPDQMSDGWVIAEKYELVPGPYYWVARDEDTERELARVKFDVK